MHLLTETRLEIKTCIKQDFFLFLPFLFNGKVMETKRKTFATD